MNYKSTIFIFVLTVMFVFNVDAQKPQRMKNKKEKMESLRIAYLTEQLELTTEQWQSFWPIYNKYKAIKEEKRMARKMSRAENDQKNAGKELDEMLKAETEALSVRKAYVKELRSVVSDETVLQYLKAERKFKERLLKRYKGDMKREEKRDRKEMKGGKKEKGI